MTVSQNGSFSVHMVIKWGDKGLNIYDIFRAQSHGRRSTDASRPRMRVSDSRWRLTAEGKNETRTDHKNSFDE